MKKFIKTAALTCVIFLTTLSIASGQQKLAQTGMKFLNVSLDARASGFANAITSLENSSASMFYNPAGMARLSNFASASLGQTKYIADINYMYGSIAFAPFQGDYGVIGVSFISVDYGDLQGTIRFDNDQGFLDVGTFNPNAMAVGIGYAKALSDKFSVGGNIKYIRQSLGTGVIGGVVVGDNGQFVSGTEEKNSLDVLAFDFGIIYRTGFKSLDFGMSLRNFSREVKYKSDGFQLPLTFQIGISMNMLDLTEIDKDMHSLLLTVDAVHPRDYPEQVNVGVEYTFMKMISLRAGYSSPNDERGFTAGVGLMKDFSSFNLGVDYAYMPFGVFNDVHKLSLHFGF